MRTAACCLLAVLALTTACHKPTATPRESNRASYRQQNAHERSEAELPHLVSATETQKDLYHAARLALRSNEDDKAFASLKKLVQTKTLSAEKRDGTLLFVQLLMQQDRTTQATALLENFIPRIPPNGDAFFMLATLQAKSGNTQKAIASLRNATRASPTLLRGWIALGTLLQKTGDHDGSKEAMLHYEREVYRIGRHIQHGDTLEERLGAIRQLRAALPDPRVSRFLAEALSSDALSVQRAALDALEHVGTSNALDAIKQYRHAASTDDLKAQADDLLHTIKERQ